MAISQSGFGNQDSSRGKASAASIFALLDQKSEIDSSNNSGLTLENVKGEIQFQNVYFRYPTRPDVQIFKDLCLSIDSGKVIISLTKIYIYIYIFSFRYFFSELVQFVLVIEFTVLKNCC